MAVKTLVVDNNPVLLKAVSTILIQEGCLVKTAGTGLEALEILQEYTPEIVFTDLIMPLVSGEQLCRILRHTPKHEDVFIVVLSAIILEDKERIIQEINCDLCIAKGSIKEIRQHIGEALQTFEKRKKASPARQAKKDARIPHRLKSMDVTSELLSEKRHLAMTLANLDEGILELSNQGKIVNVNNAALDILSSREELLVGVGIAEAIDWGQFGEPIRQWTEEQLTSRGMGRYEIFEESPLQLKGRIIIGSFLPVIEADDVFAICILRDITRQYLAEQHNKDLDNAFKLAKKMDALSCMAGGVAHDFNNLLTVICGNLDILMHYRTRQSSEERVKLIEQARKAALVAVDLTRQISCFSNFGIVSRAKIDFSQLVHTSVDSFFEAQPGDYRMSGDCSRCQVYVDPEEISQAIANVLQNGVEASGGGRIEIQLGKSIFDTAQLVSGQYISAGSYAKVELRDFGKGIIHELLPRIFDPYYSTKERGALKGMGLGLTVVYATLRNHGGHVIVESDPGEGTAVSLFLPISLDDEKQGISRKTAAVPYRYVLIIDQDDQMREIGAIMLEHLGYSVVKASSRVAAITEMKRFVDDPLLPRPLIILDLSETNGESAVETCRLLLDIDSKLKIIAMSGTILDPIMANCRKYGFVSTLTKPYSMDSLKHIVGMVVNT